MRIFITDLRSRRFLLSGIGILFISAIFVSPLLATWITFYEDFEEEVSGWPWERNGNSWFCSPWPPNQNAHTWGAEENTVYYPDHPENLNSLWCSGLPNDLMPGNEDYQVNLNSPAIASWGPFSLMDALEAEGSFRIWADIESNINDTGDNFRFQIIEETAPEANIALVYDLQEDTQHLWSMVSFNFADLDSAGESVSYIDRDSLFIQVIFEDDGDDQRGLGVFLDNIIFGYENGMHDYYANGIQTMELLPDDTYQEVDTLSPGIPVYLKGTFTFAGPDDQQADNEVWHYIYINDEPFDSIRASWMNSRYGEAHEYIYQPAWVPADTGLYTLSFRLDTSNEQEEDNEENNIYDVDVYVIDPDELDVNESGKDILPDEFRITSAFPNPFNPTVEISISIPSDTDLTANWYSIDGRMVESTFYQNVAAGYKNISWSPQDVSSGVYFLRLNSNLGTATTKVIYLR